MKVKLTGKADDKGVPYVEVIGKRKSDEELRKLLVAHKYCTRRERCKGCPMDVIRLRTNFSCCQFKSMLEWVLGE